MGTRQRIASGVFVQRSLDGLTLQVRGVSPGQVANLGFLLFFLSVPVLSASLMGLVRWVQHSESPLGLLAFGVCALGAVLGSRFVTQKLAEALGPLYWQTFTIQGRSLTVRSIVHEKHIPLSDILAFDATNCLLVTSEFRAVTLAPMQPLPVRKALAVMVYEALDGSCGGSREDIPEALAQVRAAGA